MPKLKQQNILHMNLAKVFKDSFHYILNNKEFCLCIFAINMVFTLTLKAIPSGFGNPLSLIWFIAYYIFWCFFYRYYYHLQPYVDRKTLSLSLKPSTKAIVLLALVAVGIIFLPMIPLFLGYNDLYFDFYEQYLILTVSNDLRSFLYKLILYGILAFLMPALICRPYLAWIASIRGRNASFSKIGNKTKGNYWQFLMLSLLLIYPEITVDQVDKWLNMQGWFAAVCGTIIFMLTNVIFAKIYDFFYIEN